MIACEPPTGIGQPSAWASAASSRPVPAVVSDGCRPIAWVATPVSRAFADSRAPRQIPQRGALAPDAEAEGGQRADRGEAVGTVRSGSALTTRNARERRRRPLVAQCRGDDRFRGGEQRAEEPLPGRAVGPQTGRSAPEVPVGERRRPTVERLAVGDLRSDEGRRRGRAGRTARKNGLATARGCTAEQRSCVRPGASPRSSVRAPPPSVDSASRTRTDSPALARTTAAASPLGPDPTTTASTSRTGPSLMAPS